MFTDSAASQNAGRRPLPRRTLLERARVAAVEACRRDDAALVDELHLIAAAAAKACSAPCAAISLVAAETSAFIGRVGFEQSEFDRNGSFCEDVVATEQSLVVADALEMPAFRDHELVQTYGLRAYAGVPLIDHDGYAIGALGVFGPQPGAFASAPLEDLAALARLSETMLSATTGNAPPPTQGWLGVKTARAHRDEAGRAGLIVLRVARQSPAEQAGLKPTDVLHSIDEYVLRQPADIVAALAGREKGTGAVVRFQRRGHWMSCRALVAGRSGR